MKMVWIVMSGGTSRVRAFDTNAVDLADEATASAEADRRNAIEREAGRDEDDVLWFPCHTFDFRSLQA